MNNLLIERGTYTEEEWNRIGLTELEDEVYCLCMGYRDGTIHSYDEVAARLNLSVEMVKRMEEDAYHKTGHFENGIPCPSQSQIHRMAQKRREADPMYHQFMAYVERVQSTCSTQEEWEETDFYKSIWGNRLPAAEDEAVAEMLSDIAV